MGVEAEWKAEDGSSKVAAIGYSGTGDGDNEGEERNEE